MLIHCLKFLNFLKSVHTFQMENDKHRLLFAQRKMEFLEDFGDSIAALSAAQESHAKIAAQVIYGLTLVVVYGSVAR